MANLERKPATGSGRPSVLIIDDSDIDREVMIDVLGESGFEAHGLPTPIGATKLAKDLGVRLVVIDQNLPAMDGSKLAALFRSNPAMRHVRVVLVSGMEESEIAAIALRARADAYVPKQRMHSDLPKTVKKLLSEERLAT